jgi:uridine phosphorylase
MEERITPQHVIQHHISQHGITIDQIGVSPVVVVSWGRRIVETLAEELGASPTDHWMYRDRHPLYQGEIDGSKVTFVRLPVGAPGTVLQMEEMIACGAHTFIGVGWAGSLQPEAHIGSFLIPAACVREEGTSPHYINDEALLRPDADLARLLEDAANEEGGSVFSGMHWPIDAPYRELVSKIEINHARGVRGVDMETSAMYALGIYRNVRVANLLVVSDEVWREWNPAFGSQELKDANDMAIKIIIRSLRSLLNASDSG